MNAAAIRKESASFCFNPVSPLQYLKTISSATAGIFISLSEMFARARETLPGPILLLYSSSIAEEKTSFDLLAPWIESRFLSPVAWSREQIDSIQKLLDTLLQSPDSLRALEYRTEDRTFFILKGAMRHFDPAPLEQKIARLEKGFPIDPADRLTSQDSGALDCAALWKELLERLKEQGISRLDPLIDQWDRIAALAGGPFIQDLQKQRLFSLKTPRFPGMPFAPHSSLRS